MAWIDTYANGAAVETSKQTASSILFALSGQTTIRQKETVETKEVRCLTESAARNKGGTVSDNTSQNVRWAHFSNRTYSITYLTGSKTEYSAARRDESGQWVVTETKRTFSTHPATLPNAWGSTELDAEGNAISLSAAGDAAVAISIDKTSSRIIWDVFQTVKTTVSEIRHIDTKAHADTIVENNTPNSGATNATVYHHQMVSLSTTGQGTPQDMVTAWVRYMSGTDKFATARYCGASEGWTVTVTQKDYDWSSPNPYSSVTGEGWKTS